MQLSEIITAKIKKDGPISFHDFMEMCLYYPELGYYTSTKEKIGQNGDYYTSPCVTPVFGTMVAKQLEEMWHLLGEDQFTIVEYGAGTGYLCHDIINHLKGNEALYNRMNYCIIEKSPVMRDKERAHLHEKVSWYDSIDAIPEVSGCILSNELLDNFSVHQVVMQDELMEVFVDYTNDFTEILQPAPAALKTYLSELNVTLPKGYRTEINLEATNWIKNIAGSLQKGYVLTIDYGYAAQELYHARRREGTLLCYHNHKINDRPYINIGEQDITTHVNFSALSHWGIKNGLDTCGFTDQAHFLLSLGLEDHLNKMRLHNNSFNYMHEHHITHTLLFDMGAKFKVMIQQKNAPEHLSGLKLSRNGKPAAYA